MNDRDEIVVPVRVLLMGYLDLFKIIFIQLEYLKPYN